MKKILFILAFCLSAQCCFANPDVNQISIPTTAGGTLIWQATPQPGKFTVPIAITILNTDSTNTIYVGNTGLTSSAGGGGFPLKPGAAITLHCRSIYGLSVGGAIVVSFITDDYQ